MALSDRQIKGLRPSEKPFKSADGGGLHVYVTPKGAKLFRLAYRFEGKEKLLSFGPYPVTSLAEARAKRDAAKALLKAGLDPSQHIKLERLAKADANANTFDAIADELLAKAEREGLAKPTIEKKRWLLSLARADLGPRPIAEITAAEILVPLRRVEAKDNFETARRLRAVIGQVFRLAVATARAETDPTFALKGALTTPKVRHRAALVDKDSFTGLIRAVWAYDGAPDTRAALQLLALLYPRPGELRAAEWLEIDLDEAEWTIPAERTKMRRAHRKPLSQAAIAILHDVRRRNAHARFVFPAIHTTQRTMSENTMNAALRRMGFTKDEATAHGFRASASSLLNESGKWSPDAIEAELGHADPDSVRRAYHRAAYWDERRSMCEWWAACVSELSGR